MLTGWDPWHTVPIKWLQVAKTRSSLTDRFHATQSAVCRCSVVTVHEQLSHLTVAHNERGRQAEGVREEGVEENIWA